MNERVYVHPKGTACTWGHPLTPNNAGWYRHSNGRFYVQCRRCRSDRRQAHRLSRPVRAAPPKRLSPADLETLNVLLVHGAATVLQVQHVTNREQAAVWTTLQRLVGARLVVKLYPHGCRVPEYRLNGIGACRV